MSIEVEGIFLSLDYSDIITESFAKRFNVDLKQWIHPFCYFDEKNQSLISNKEVPDGTYILLGRISYPGEAKYTYHTTLQFNIVKIQGFNLIFARPLNGYLNMPKALLNSITPNFPLFKIGETSEYKKATGLYTKISKQHLTADSLKDIILKQEPNSIESKFYRIRLAIQRQIEREQEKWLLSL